MDKNVVSSEIPILPISVVADVLKVHQRTLRIYDEEGILVPKRSDTNRRLYSYDDVKKGKAIQYLTRDLGINITGVKIIFHLLDTKSLTADYIPALEGIVKRLNITIRVSDDNHAKKGRPKNIC